MIALLDIGNTHTHLGLANARRVLRHTDVLTRDWNAGASKSAAARFLKTAPLTGAILCSVVPSATPLVTEFLRSEFGLACLELNARTVRGVGVDYPNPHTIGPDRLANAVAVKHHFGAPAVVVDFGTAVTFDVVDASGDYIGGIIAPGLECDDRLSARKNRPVAAHSHPRGVSGDWKKYGTSHVDWRRQRLSRPHPRVGGRIEAGHAQPQIAGRGHRRLRQTHFGQIARDYFCAAAADFGRTTPRLGSDAEIRPIRSANEFFTTKSTKTTKEVDPI
jgi:hypothetical protein